MSQYNYVVTAAKPSSVTASITAHFTDANKSNLIVAKCTRLVVYELSEDGLAPKFELPMYGRIATLDKITIPDTGRDVLFICTERLKFTVLEYEPSTGEVTTRANGDVADRIGRLTDNGQIGIIDPSGRMIGMHMYDGLFKVIPIDKGSLQEAFNIRLEELQVLDVKFLHGCAVPTVMVLYQDPKLVRHVKTYEVSLKEKDFQPGPWVQTSVEEGATTVIPVPLPLGGALLIGQHTIAYWNGTGGDHKALSMRAMDVRSYTMIDDNGSRWLIGDDAGILHVLVLEHDDNKVLSLTLQPLGETSCSSTLSYLDNGVVFVGSTFGDSQLVRLHVEKDDTGSNVEVLDTFVNLGPISDFCVVDLERQGQGQVVTCSGAFKDGSLRVIRNGIGINEQAEIELPGIKGMWSLRPTFDSEFDTYLVQSFVGETRILGMTDEELEETEFPGLDADQQTLLCLNTSSHILQVTAVGARLIKYGTLDLAHNWSPPEGSRITAVTANATHALVTVGSGKLIALSLAADGFSVVAEQTLEHEIACMDASPLGTGAGQSAALCAVGLWDMSIRVLSFPALQPLTKEDIGTKVIPRSVQFVTLDADDYLMCGLGDGNLLTFRVDATTAALSDRKKLSLGTQPISMTVFKAKDQQNVFASSDRPTVIHSSNGKVVFSNVNLKKVTHMAPFNNDGFPDSLAIATESTLVIGTIDEIQKLHIRSFPLKEHPRRIAHMDSARAFCVATVKAATGDDDEDTHSVKLFDDSTFEVLDTATLQEYENICALTCTTFNEAATMYFVVGTAFAFPQENEPTKGRILVYEVIDQKLRLVTEKEVTGAVYALNAFQGKLLGSVNSRVELFRFSEEGGRTAELASETSQLGHVMALYLQSRGDFIVVGDLMRSMSLLAYKPVEASIEEIARDFDPNWMTAIEILDDDTFLGAENHCNLFTLRKNTDATTDEERQKLENVGSFHLGEMVNRFRHGSLVMQMPDADGTPPVPTMLFGTVHGVVGVIASLTEAKYAVLLKLQEALTTVIKGIGGLSHHDFRSFVNERKTSASKNFLDGDLIENFLDLKRDKMREVAAIVGSSVEDLTQLVEELQRLH